MTQQKYDRRGKPEGHRKGAKTRRIESVGGGKAATVNEQALQLGLRLGTAENPKGAVGTAAVGQPTAAVRAAPKPRRNEQRATSATMQEVCERLSIALETVVSNREAAGPDRQRIDQVREHWSELEPKLRDGLPRPPRAGPKSQVNAKQRYPPRSEPGSSRR